MSTAQKCKTKYLAKSLLLNSVVAASLLLAVKLVFAQEQPRTITIVPPTVSQELNPGEIAEGKLKVINDSNSALTFKSQVKDFIVEDKAGTPKILPDNTLSAKYSGASWLAVSPDSFTVRPGESYELSYYLQVPLDAKPGGRYAAVLYEPQELLQVEGSGTGVQTHLGSLFYIRVKGPVTEAAEVTKFEANGFQEYGPVAVTTDIKNNSGVHIRPKGVITVKNMLGQVVDSQQLTEQNIFPEATREFENTFGKKFMFGRYTAELVGTYGIDNNLPLNAATSFIIFPWKIAGIIVLAVVAITLGALFYNKKRKENHQTPPPPTTV